MTTDNRLRVVSEAPDAGEPDADVRFDNPDLTPKMMGLAALATIAVFLGYAAARIAGLDAAQSLMAVTYVNGAIAGIIYGVALVKKGSYPWLLAMIALAATLTGACFAVCHSTQNFNFLLVGAGVMFVAFLTSLLRNVDERVAFMPLIMSMLVSSTLILFCLG